MLADFNDDLLDLFLRFLLGCRSHRLRSSARLAKAASMFLAMPPNAGLSTRVVAPAIFAKDCKSRGESIG